MPDPLSAAERYRSDAVKLFELAKDAPNPFFRDYYNGLAKRYLMHAENQEKVVKTSEGAAATEVISDSPSVQDAPESSLEEEAISVGAPPHTVAAHSRSGRCSPTRSAPPSRPPPAATEQGHVIEGAPRKLICLEPSNQNVI
jgi:hypothetical protein